MTFAERIASYKDAKDSLLTMIGHLTAISDFLNQYNELLSSVPSREVLTNLGVMLTIEGSNLTDASWTPERIAEAHRAVIAMINRIASDSGQDSLFALMLFIEVFGGTNIILFEGNFGDESYASTSDDGRIIYLYTQPTEFLQSDLDRCGELLGIDDPTYNTCVGNDFIVHSAENIIHEYGHVLQNRYRESHLFEVWDQEIRNFLFPFDTTQGWTDNQFDRLQNRSIQKDVTEGRMTQIQLENERIANMFEAWVSGVQPELDATNNDQVRRAWAMWTYMTGECPPAELNVPCSDMGFGDWIIQFGGLS